MRQDKVEEKCFTVYPLIWTKELHEKFKPKNSWIFASVRKVRCTLCREVNNLGVRASRRVNISTQWAERNVTFYVSTREVQLSLLPQKFHKNRNLKAYNKAINILEMAKKDILFVI